MRVISKLVEFREAREDAMDQVGFVPTMGYLHEGHLVLVRRAKQENGLTVVSIFVNPAQFGPREDYTKYPRDPERDLDLLVKEGTDFVFMPSAEDMYPPGCSTWVDVEGVTEKLEGASRPGHFRGVSTVVAKLFGIVEPTRAYFGQKDAQQVVVIKKMVSDLNMNVEVVAVPTVRESDGLAMSSRNVYLDQKERQAALVLWKSLNLARELRSKGETNADTLRKAMTELIGKESLARIDYVSVANPENLVELTDLNQPALVSMAVYIGKTRLIDNMMLPA